MSTDGGRTWKNIDKTSVHADHHALWINPNRDSHIINGNDGGINISYDNGDHWFKANTLRLGNFTPLLQIMPGLTMYMEVYRTMVSGTSFSTTKKQGWYQ
jgi:hypothetical protein